MAGHRLGAVEGGGGVPAPLQMHPWAALLSGLRPRPAPSHNASGMGPAGTIRTPHPCPPPPFAGTTVKAPPTTVTTPPLDRWCMRARCSHQQPNSASSRPTQPCLRRCIQVTYRRGAAIGSGVGPPLSLQPRLPHGLPCVVSSQGTEAGEGGWAASGRTVIGIPGIPSSSPGSDDQLDRHGPPAKRTARLHGSRNCDRVGLTKGINQGIVQGCRHPRSRSPETHCQEKRVGGSRPPRLRRRAQQTLLLARGPFLRASQAARQHGRRGLV